MEVEDEEDYKEYEEEDDVDNDDNVMGYGEMQERGMAGADIMATDIEGSGALARAQQKLDLKTGSAADRRLVSYYRQIKNLYKRFAPNDEVLMFDKFKSLPNQRYKNPYAFVLAYIALREEKTVKKRVNGIFVYEQELTRADLQTIFGYAKELNTPNISEADVIRYYRLLKRL
jgi:hypothetical protein